MRCPRCGENHYIGDCENSVHCANCGGKHQATDRQCIVYAYNLEVIEIKSKLEANFRDAAAITSEKFLCNYNIDIGEDHLVSSDEDKLRYNSDKSLQKNLFSLQPAIASGKDISSQTEISGVSPKSIDLLNYRKLVEKISRELFLLTKPKILEIFGNNPEFLEACKTFEEILSQAATSIDSSVEWEI